MEDLHDVEMRRREAAKQKERHERIATEILSGSVDRLARIVQEVSAKKGDSKGEIQEQVLAHVNVAIIAASILVQEIDKVES
jgi:hypothetical protein